MQYLEGVRYELERGCRGVAGVGLLSSYQIRRLPSEGGGRRLTVPVRQKESPAALVWGCCDLWIQLTLGLGSFRPSGFIEHLEGSSKNASSH